MNKLTTLFAGIFGCFAFAWMGLVFIPNEQLGKLGKETTEDGDAVPKSVSGLVTRGREVYAANGCLYCHSQQIRPVDVEDGHNRGWGARRTVPRDYLEERPPFLGTMRTGPDLTNIGHRQPSAEWHLKHLYMPWAITPNSIMPSYSFLFETRKVTGAPSPDAIKMDPPYAAKPGEEIVPTDDAKALVAYLQSLDRTYPLTEAPEK